MSRRKVVIIGPAYPYRGGLASFSERLAKAFCDNGDEVEIITFTLQYPSFLFPGKTQFSEGLAPEGLKITRSINAVNPFNWFFCGRKIAKLNPDLVIVKYWLPLLGPCLGTISRIVKRKSAAKVLSILHNVVPHEKRPGDKLFTKYFLKPFDTFVALSKSVVEDLKQFEPNKPCVFSPHPLYDNYGNKIERNEALEKLGLDANKRYMLFFGIIRPYKGLDLLLEAFGQVIENCRDVDLIIAGEFYEQADKYLTKISDPKFADRIHHFDGFIPDSEVVNYFCGSDLVTQPYKSATQSGVAQIAYHFEIPLLVTNVGGLPELVPNGKVGYVVAVNPQEISDAIFRFFRQNMKEEFEQGLREEKTKYSWERLVANINQISSYEKR